MAVINRAVIGFPAQYTDDGSNLHAGQVVGLIPQGGEWSSRAILRLATGERIENVPFNDSPSVTNSFRWPGGIEPAFGFARQTDPLPERAK